MNNTWSSCAENRHCPRGTGFGALPGRKTPIQEPLERIGSQEELTRRMDRMMHREEEPMPDPTLTINGVQVPRFLYGTAWKEEQTQRLTELALQQGFRGIDTANQRRHYHEAAVGQAIAAEVESGRVARDELFLQTKFTFRGGQDHRLPYDPEAPIPVQVEQS